MLNFQISLFATLDLVLCTMQEILEVSRMVVSSSSFSHRVTSLVVSFVVSMSESVVFSSGESTRLSSLCWSSEVLSPLLVGVLRWPPGDSPGVEVVGLIKILEFCGVSCLEQSILKYKASINILYGFIYIIIYSYLTLC